MAFSGVAHFAQIPGNMKEDRVGALRPSSGRKDTQGEMNKADLPTHLIMLIVDHWIYLCNNIADSPGFGSSAVADQCSAGR